jgi:methionyl-tRNA synthetase
LRAENKKYAQSVRNSFIRLAEMPKSTVLVRVFSKEERRMSEKYTTWYCRSCRKIYRDFKVAEKCKYCGSPEIFENDFGREKI